MKRLLASVLPILFSVFIASASAQSTIFIVRHAEKGDAVGSDPKDPGLSDIGHARAERLAQMLRDAGIISIYASEFKRTRETAEPLAQTLHLEVTTVPARETAALLAKLTATPGSGLIVAHSNTIPDLIKAMGIGAPIAIAETDYDNLFVLTRNPEPTLIRLHY